MSWLALMVQLPIARALLRRVSADCEAKESAHRGGMPIVLQFIFNRPPKVIGVVDVFIRRAHALSDCLRCP